jgi:hypothetical protein
MRTRMKCHRPRSDHTRLFHETLVQPSAARLDNLLKIAIPTSASLCFRLNKVARIAGYTPHPSRIDDRSPRIVRKTIATAGLHTVSNEGQDIRGRQLASWGERPGSDDAWLAQAVKVR